jgi:hypothetical protein
MPRLTVQQGISAPAVTSIPSTWDRQWFRNFITNFMVNMDLRNIKLGEEFLVTTNVSGNTTTGETNIPAVSVPLFTATTPGTVPATGGVAATNFINAAGQWAVPAGSGGGTPGGANTQVQYNNSGTFAGSSNFVWNNASTTLTIGGTINATILNSTSDPKLKDNIAIIDNYSSIIANLNGYRFTWKKNGQASMGLMSTEVKRVAPELVIKVGEHDAINYNGIIAILVEEVKSLRRRVLELEVKNSDN